MHTCTRTQPSLCLGWRFRSEHQISQTQSDVRLMVKLKKRLLWEAKRMWRAARTHARTHAFTEQKPGCSWRSQAWRGAVLYRGVSMTLEEWAEQMKGQWGHCVEALANQRGEKPVAKLQPTTCVISHICGDKQPTRMSGQINVDVK